MCVFISGALFSYRDNTSTFNPGATLGFTNGSTKALFSRVSGGRRALGVGAVGNFIPDKSLLKGFRSIAFIKLKAELASLEDS